MQWFFHKLVIGYTDVHSHMQTNSVCSEFDSFLFNLKILPLCLPSCEAPRETLSSLVNSNLVVWKAFFILQY